MYKKNIVTIGCHISTVIVFLCSTFAPSPLLAQDKPSWMIEEVVVTARKREEGLQSTPIAISAFSGESLEARGVTNLGEITNFTPNLTFQDSPNFGGADGNAAIFIRGIGQSDFLATVEPGVGLYVDGVYIARSVGGMLDLIDVERVEVLRGPQGTLFGRNTIGGAVSITTRKPNEELAGKISASYGTDDYIDVKGNVNVPINDTLFASLSLARTVQDGHVVRDDGLDLGDKDKLSGRLGLRFIPNDKWEFNLALDGSSSDVNGPAFVLLDIAEESDTLNNPALLFPPPVPPTDNFAQLWNFVQTFSPAAENCLDVVPGQPVRANNNTANPACYSTAFVRGKSNSAGTARTFSKTRIYGASFTADYAWNDDIQVKSISSYRRLDSKFNREGDHSPFPIIYYTDIFEQSQFTQELQLVGTHDKFNWLLGGYFFREYGFNTNDVFFLPVDLRSGGKFDSESKAIFAQLTYDFTEQLSLTLGYRYTDEKKTFTPIEFIIDDRTGPPPAGANPLFGDGTPLAPFGQVKFEIGEGTPYLNLAYRWNDDLMTYVSYSEGFKSGGFSQRIFPPVPALLTFEPEFVKVYELGFKWSGFDNRMRLNGAVFYSDYTDLQLQVFEGIAPITRNAAEASILGFELDMLLLPAEGWTVEAAIGYLDAEYEEFDPTAQLSFRGALGLPSVFDVTEDDALPRTSEWTLSASVSKEIQLEGNAGVLTPRLDWSWRSEFHNDSFNTQGIKTPNHHLLNANLSWQFKDTWEVVASVKNLTDEEFLEAGVFNPQFGPLEGVFNRGREWGINIKKHF